ADGRDTHASTSCGAHHNPQRAATATVLAAVTMTDATACGCETYTEWLPVISVTCDPARFDIARCASGGIIRSLVATMYQLGLPRHAGWVIAPASASTPHGTCESAMNAAVSGSTSAANDAANFALSRKRNPSCGGRIGGTGAPGGGLAMSDETDSPA